MDKNSIEFQELEELRGQVSLLKEKLMRQQIISERAIIEAAQKLAAHDDTTVSALAAQILAAAGELEE